ncbi:MAG: nucleotidyl transferase AbiEii/AbiGii toxin family protein [Candidatus Micrarchaeia archaeon]
MDYPIGSMLRGEKLAIAQLQDTLIEIIYNHVQPDAVLYGGTAVWRCYGGGRFSEDIDIYVSKSFSKRLLHELRKHNLTIVWKNPELESNARISDGQTNVLLEAKTGMPESVIAQYEKVDGTRMTISTLSPLELAVRKMEAYSGRRYIRDLYDLVQLTNFLDKNDYYVRQKFSEFIKGMKAPVDEHILRSLVYKGYGNYTFRVIADYLKRWLNEV